MAIVRLLLLVSTGLMPLWAAEPDAKAALGGALFFDKGLSRERNLACATCHDPNHGFVDTRDGGVGAAASLGDDLRSLGDRNSPSLSYAALIPAFQYDAENARYIGGLFWDGRARDLREQAGQPLLNPTEMAMPDRAAVVERVRAIDDYRDRFEALYGTDLFSDHERAFAAITDAIAEFEKTPFFSSFDSKYDRYLRGEYELSDLEDLGMSIFFSTTNSNCSNCHLLKVMGDAGETFTNHEYHNIGTPINLALRQRNGLGSEHRDLGLGSQLADASGQEGKFRVPTLRNVAITGPYMHNGVFRDLRTVIEFYDQYNHPMRVNNPETGQPWSPPEIESTVDLEELKAKRLNDRKVDALIAFLKTLTDRRYEHLLD